MHGSMAFGLEGWLYSCMLGKEAIFIHTRLSLLTKSGIGIWAEYLAWLVWDMLLWLQDYSCESSEGGFMMFMTCLVVLGFGVFERAERRG